MPVLPQALPGMASHRLRRMGRTRQRRGCMINEGGVGVGVAAEVVGGGGG